MGIAHMHLKKYLAIATRFWAKRDEPCPDRISLLLGCLFGIPAFLILYLLLVYPIGVEISTAVLMIPVGIVIAVLIFRRGRMRRFAKVLAIYGACLLPFTGTYFVIYYFAPQAFSFASGIVSEAEEQHLLLDYYSLSTSLRRSALLAEVNLWMWSVASKSDLRRILAHRFVEPWTIPSGLKVEHVFRTEVYVDGALGAPSERRSEEQLRITDKKGTETFILDPMISQSNNFQHPIKQETTLLTIRQKMSEREYASQLHDSYERENAIIRVASGRLRGVTYFKKFSVLDFLYFSVMTVATVGYGDIIPNSTGVRLIVVAQVLLGAFLVVSTSNETIQPSINKSVR
jgi:hypothetical protein